MGRWAGMSNGWLFGVDASATGCRAPTGVPSGVEMTAFFAVKQNSAQVTLEHRSSMEESCRARRNPFRSAALHGAHRFTNACETRDGFVTTEPLPGLAGRGAQPAGLCPVPARARAGARRAFGEGARGRLGAGATRR